jgi:hypothetical protein
MFRTSRRHFLRGATVCLALPYLESLAPSTKVAAQAAPMRRLLVGYFPNGVAAQYWPVQGVGQGNAWTLSPLLEPLAGLKSKMTVLTNLENYSCMQAGPEVEPSHARLCGAYLTCDDSDRLRQEMDVEVANAVSMDQIIAARMATPLKSLEVGLSTLDSYTDGRHPALSRSIAWRTATQPLYKDVNPQAVFDRLVASGATDSMGGLSAEARAEAERRKKLKLSALDFVMESARSLSAKLGREDKPRLDQFFTSVRELEERVRAFNIDAQMGLSCDVIERPTEVYAVNVTDGYNRGRHGDLMTDLIVMAFRCDVTRVVTHMLDDARSDFVYDHLTERQFTAGGSTPGNGTVNGFHGLQHAGDSNNGYATINYSFSERMYDLCKKLDEIPEGDGTMLDHSLVLYGSGMQGSNHDANKLPIVLIGGGAAGFRTDQHIAFPDTPEDRPLRDLHYTILNRFFDCKVPSFGVSVKGAENKVIEELLA